MPLRLPQLEESLCGCSLKAASKIIGWIYVVVSISIIWILIAMLCFDGSRLISEILGIDLVELPNYHCNSDTDCYSFKTYKASETVHFVSLAIATSLIVSAIFNSLLLVGIYHNRPHFIRAWIVALIFGIFIDSITVISTLIAQPYNPFLRLCILCINIYCLLIVNSYHVNLKQGRPAVNLEQGTPAVNLEQGTPAFNLEQGTPAVNLEQRIPAVYLKQGRPAEPAGVPSAPPAYVSCI